MFLYVLLTEGEVEQAFPLASRREDQNVVLDRLPVLQDDFTTAFGPFLRLDRLDGAAFEGAVSSDEEFIVREEYLILQGPLVSHEHPETRHIENRVRMSRNKSDLILCAVQLSGEAACDLSTCASSANDNNLLFVSHMKSEGKEK